MLIEKGDVVKVKSLGRICIVEKILSVEIDTWEYASFADLVGFHNGKVFTTSIPEWHFHDLEVVKCLES